MKDALTVLAGLVLCSGVVAVLFLWGLWRAMRHMYSDQPPPPRDERPPPPVRPGRR